MVRPIPRIQLQQRLHVPVRSRQREQPPGLDGVLADSGADFMQKPKPIQCIRVPLRCGTSQSREALALVSLEPVAPSLRPIATTYCASGSPRLASPSAIAAISATKFASFMCLPRFRLPQPALYPGDLSARQHRGTGSCLPV